MRLRGSRAAGVAVATALLLALAGSGCATSRSTAVESGPTGQPASDGWTTVRYGQAVFTVPGGWPVFDLAEEPDRCVLFNVHAVYLGRQGANADCPAQAFGRTDAVQVQPLDAQARQAVLPSPADHSINGEKVAIEPDGDATRSLVVSFVGLGVLVRATYATDPSIATAIVQSVRRAA